MKVHELKTWPSMFAAIAGGQRTCEVRSTRDRDFAVGDRLHLQEWDPSPDKLLGGRRGYTGKSITAEVTHIVPGGSWGLPEHLAVMSIRLVYDVKE